MRRLDSFAWKAPLRSRALVRLIPLLVLLAIFLLYTLPWLTRGTENMRLLSSLSSDEPYVVDITRCMLNHGNVAVAPCAPYLPDWPRLFFYLCLGAIYPARAVFPTTPTTIAVACRSITLVFGLLSVVATYLMALRMFGRRIAFWAGLLFLTSSVFLRWSLTIHPDVPQLFFVTLSLLFAYRLVEAGRWRDVVLSSVFAGLGFSTKYAGAFVLPAIGLGAAWYLYCARRPRRVSDWLAWAAQTIIQGVAALLTFAAAYVLTTPEFITSMSAVSGSLWVVAADMNTKGKGGSIFRGRLDPLGWLATLTSSDVLGLVCGLLVIALGAGALVRLARRDKMPRPGRGQWIIGAWLVLFVAFLLGYMTYVAPFHALPIVPVVCVFASWALVYLWQTGRSARFGGLGRANSLTRVVLCGTAVVLMALVIGDRVAAAG